MLILLTTEALDDLWANPLGTYRTHVEAKKVYKFLDAKDKIAVWYRKGKHFHGIDDWRTMLDFMAWQLEGKTSARKTTMNFEEIFR